MSGKHPATSHQVAMLSRTRARTSYIPLRDAQRPTRRVIHPLDACWPTSVQAKRLNQAADHPPLPIRAANHPWPLAPQSSRASRPAPVDVAGVPSLVPDPVEDIADQDLFPQGVMHLSFRTRMIIKFHRSIWKWTVMLSKEAPVEDGRLYQYGSGHSPSWQLTWWRTR